MGSAADGSVAVSRRIERIRFGAALSSRTLIRRQPSVRFSETSADASVARRDSMPCTS